MVTTVTYRKTFNIVLYAVFYKISSYWCDIDFATSQKHTKNVYSLAFCMRKYVKWKVC